MISGLWGKKLGMTQLFTEDNKVVPVTAINTAHWFVTGLKTNDNDGYSAVQVGRLRKRYEASPFDSAWLKNLKKYFLHVHEILLNGDVSDLKLGQSFDGSSVVEQGAMVDVFGISKGRGFQGVMKRHGFSGGPASHGSEFKRAPGSIGNFCSEGRVAKGQKLPGQMGAKRAAVRGLEVVRVQPEEHMVLVKGSVPGNTGSVVFVRKQVDKK